MSDPDDFPGVPAQCFEKEPPFTSQQVVSRFHLALIRRKAQRRARLVISGVALLGALLAFLFLNMNGEIGPGFFEPTLVRAATPFPTMTTTPLPPDHEPINIIVP